MKRLCTLIALLMLPAVAHAAGPTIAAMRWHRRIVLIAAPAHDADAARQRATLARWGAQARARDITLVEIAGSTVTGAADPAPDLRRRYRLSPEHFQVLLIGKDGHVALRSRHLQSAGHLQQLIDAMPMRQAGGR
jgi:hypothetical protein